MVPRPSRQGLRGRRNAADQQKQFIDDQGHVEADHHGSSIKKIDHWIVYRFTLRMAVGSITVTDFNSWGVGKMKYEIHQISPEDLSNAYKYEQIPELNVGEGFLVPWADMSYEAARPGVAVQSIAYYWGKKLGRRYVTKKVKEGVWIMRVE